METIIEKIKPKDINYITIDKAASILKRGGLVAFPTETVYGLGANALDRSASKKIYMAKGRPSDNPLIVHISNVGVLNDLTLNISETAKTLIDVFWPGPLTLIFNKNKNVPDSITGGLKTVAIRMPSHPIAKEIINRSGIPIAAPSANISGRPSPTSAKHVIEDLDGKVDMIIDGGKVNIGLESSVVDLTSEKPIILRPGYVTKEMLSKIVGDVDIDPSLISLSRDIIPRSPGMKYKHYAPQGELYIVDGELSKVVNKIKTLALEKESLGYKVGIIASQQTREFYKDGFVKIIGDRNNEEEIAKSLFEVLREFDKINVDYIFSETFKSERLGEAIMNRLLKAAGNKKIIIS
ncbi:MAG: L-threonylcarbamoyladenylate synthase [Eubacteriales bacterium]